MSEIDVTEPTPFGLCAECGETKPANEFHRNRARSNGLFIRCKPCVKAALDEPGEKRDLRLAKKREKLQARRQSGVNVTTIEQRRAWAKQNPEKVRAYTRTWAAKNPERVSDSRRRYRARVRDVTEGPVDFDALWTGFCDICDQAIDPALRKPDLMCRSIDHIIPLSKGGTHSQGNLAWVHLLCNLRKGNKIP